MPQTLDEAPSSAAEIERGRSFLYVPADDSRKLASADRSSADVVVADLEDAVTPARKDVARSELARFAAGRSGVMPLLVRVNSVSSGLIADDLQLVRSLPLAGLVLPKAHVEDLDRLAGNRLPVLAMVEDARGIREAGAIGSDYQVVRLGLGGVDLSTELGLRRLPDGLELVYARSSLVLDSALARLPPPVDSPFVDYRDQTGLAHEAELVRALGFGGKACIHPAQLEGVAHAFSPSSDEIQWASDVVRAFESEPDRGVTSHQGSMIDAPVVARARALLSQIERRETE